MRVHITFIDVLNVLHHTFDVSRLKTYTFPITYIDSLDNALKLQKSL